MAEAVASILGIATFGLEVTKSLYKAADVMIHARQQISSIARHVSQCARAMNRLGRAIEAYETDPVISKAFIRDSIEISRSYRQTLEEIQSVINIRDRRFTSLRWYFRKTKAKELQARLDSETSTIQLMLQIASIAFFQAIHTEAGEIFTNLKAEVDISQNLVLENYNNLRRLQHAEQKTPKDGRDLLLSSSPAPPDYFAPENENRKDCHEIAEPDGITSEGATRQNDENECLAVVRKRLPPVACGDDGDAFPKLNDDDGWTSTDDESDPRKKNQRLTPQSSTNRDAVYNEQRPQTSATLMAMVPYKPKFKSTNNAHPRRVHYLISGRNNTSTESKNEPGSMYSQTTEAVRKLLDKWTNRGSRPIFDEIRGQSNETKLPPPKWTSTSQHEPARDKLPDRKGSGKTSTPSRRRGSKAGADSYSINDGQSRAPPAPLPPGFRPYAHDPPPTGSDPEPRIWPPRSNPRLRGQYAPVPNPRQGPQVLNLYNSAGHFGLYEWRNVAEDFLNHLRTFQTSDITYEKRNEFCEQHFVGTREFYRINFVPPHLPEPRHLDEVWTVIGANWVRPEVLDLLDYAYEVDEPGVLAIEKNLSFVEILDLVKLSLEALVCDLKKHSQEVIKRRRWEHLVPVSSAQPTAPQPTPGFPVASQVPPNPQVPIHSPPPTAYNGAPFPEDPMKLHRTAPPPPPTFNPAHSRFHPPTYFQGGPQSHGQQPTSSFLPDYLNSYRPSAVHVNDFQTQPSGRNVGTDFQRKSNLAPQFGSDIVELSDSEPFDSPDDDLSEEEVIMQRHRTTNVRYGSNRERQDTRNRDLQKSEIGKRTHKERGRFRDQDLSQYDDRYTEARSRPVNPPASRQRPNTSMTTVRQTHSTPFRRVRQYPLASIGNTTRQTELDEAENYLKHLEGKLRALKAEDEEATSNINDAKHLRGRLRALEAEEEEAKSNTNDAKHLRGRLRALEAKYEEAKSNGDLALASDLEYYAIPDVKSRLDAIESQPYQRKSQQDEQSSYERTRHSVGPTGKGAAPGEERKVKVDDIKFSGQNTPMEEDQTRRKPIKRTSWFLT